MAEDWRVRWYKYSAYDDDDDDNGPLMTIDFHFGIAFGGGSFVASSSEVHPSIWRRTETACAVIIGRCSEIKNRNHRYVIQH